MSKIKNWILERWKRPEKDVQADPEQFGYRPVEASTVEIDAINPSEFRQILTDAESGDIASQAELFEKMEERDGLLDTQLRTRRMGVRACG